MAKAKKLKDLKAPTAGEGCRALENEGWQFDHQRGSHRPYLYKNGAEVIVAEHGGSGGTIPKGTWCAMRKAILAAMSILLVLAVILPLVVVL